MNKSRRSFVIGSLALGTAAGVARACKTSDASLVPASAHFFGGRGHVTGAENAVFPYIFEDAFVERRNIAWRVEPGRMSPHNPLLAGQYPWDESTPFYTGTVLKDPLDGLWKLWGAACPRFAGHRWGEWDFRLGYATSEDGVHWVRPMLSGFPCLGHAKSNVLLDFPDSGACMQMSVLVNPRAEKGRRYEMFLFCKPAYKNPSQRVKGLSVRQEHLGQHPAGVYRFFSPDGIHWRAVEGPLEVETCDSIFVFRDLGAPYVAYHRLGVASGTGSAYVPYDPGAGETRTLVRRESEDGSRWSEPPLTVFTPDWRDAHDTQFMDLAPLRQGSGYVATVAVFHALNQTMDIQFAGSPDGRRWFRPIPRVPCVANGPLGTPGGGHIFQSHQLVEDGDLLHLYYGGNEGLHGDIYTDINQQRYGSQGQEACWPHGALCRATWDRGRLWAIVPSAGGPAEAVATSAAAPDCAGKELVINAVTKEDGHLQAELLTGDRNPVKGFQRDDCQPFRGDSKTARLVWRGGSHCPMSGLRVRFFLCRSRLYGFEWR